MIYHTHTHTHTHTQTPIEQVQAQTRHLVRQIAKMQETLNTLAERLESMDKSEVKHHNAQGKKDGEQHEEETDASQQLPPKETDASHPSQKETDASHPSQQLPQKDDPSAEPKTFL